MFNVSVIHKLSNFKYCFPKKENTLKNPIYSCHITKEAVFPYFSNVNMTLVSVIQSACLALFLNNVFRDIFLKDSNYIIVPGNLLNEYCLRYLLTIITIVLVWHKYINHHQFIGWQSKWIDSFVIISFGIIEAFLIQFSHGNEHFFQFYITSILILFIGSLAYYNAYIQFNKHYVKGIYEFKFSTCNIKYSCQDKSCYNIIDFMNIYLRKSWQYCFWGAVLLLFYVVVVYFLKNCNSSLISFLEILHLRNILFEILSTLIFCGIYIYFLIFLDLKLCMEKNTNKFKN